MQTFSGYVNAPDSKAVTHLPHLEDLVLQPGGAAKAFAILSELGKVLEGEKPMPSGVSVKWDGSPAIVFGHDPNDGRFFVSTKSAFAKNPKLAKSAADIDAMFPESIRNILHTCFRELPAICPNGMYQGDFLFDAVGVKTVADKGVAVAVSFAPNVVEYSVPYESPMGQAVRNAAMGIVLHTKLSITPDSEWLLEPMTDADYAKLPTTPRVLVVSSLYAYTPDCDFDVHEKLDWSLVMDALQAHVSLFVNTPSKVYDDITGPLKSLLPQFINAKVRDGQMPTTRSFVSEFYHWLTEYARKKSETLSTTDGKLRMLARFNAVGQNMLVNVGAWQDFWRVWLGIVEAKECLLSKLRGPAWCDSTIEGKPGVEGFVYAVNPALSVKLINRMQFSRTNMLRGKYVRSGKP